MIFILVDCKGNVHYLLTLSEQIYVHSSKVLFLKAAHLRDNYAEKCRSIRDTRQFLYALVYNILSQTLQTTWLHGNKSLIGSNICIATRAISRMIKYVQMHPRPNRGNEEEKINQETIP